MTTPAIADKKPRRRWFSPRFSLKMLMLAVTAAAIGSAVWWRWPVTIKRVIRQSPLIEETYDLSPRAVGESDQARPLSQDDRWKDRA